MSDKVNPIFVISKVNERGIPTEPTIFIFADGRVEGINGNYTVSNRLPMALAQAEHNGRMNGIALRAAALGQSADQTADKVSGAVGPGTPSIGAGTASGGNYNTQAHIPGVGDAAKGILDAKRKARNDAVEHIEKFFDGMDQLFKSHFDPLFKRR